MSQTEKGRRITAAKTRHGHAVGGPSPEYRSWMQMAQRCANQKNPAFSRYGGRGIRVCDRWASFDNFIADMGPRPAGTSIDRIDNDGGYEPGNCRWATTTEQARNQKKTRRLTLGDETLPVSEWAERLGVSAKTLWTRIYAGWSVERVLSSEVRRWPSCV